MDAMNYPPSELVMKRPRDDEDSGEPTVVSILEYTQSQLEELTKSVEVLADRLRPVLRPEADEPNVSPPMPKNPDHSPLAEVLEDRNSELNRLIRRVNRLTGRIHL